MFGLWRTDVDLDDLADEPRWFIEGLLRGESEEIAAQRAGVTLDVVRAWAGDAKFRVALKRARRGIGRATPEFASDLAGVRVLDADGRPWQGPIPEDRTTQFLTDGSVIVRPNAVPADRRIVTDPPAGTFSLPAGAWGEYAHRTAWGEPADDVLTDIRGRSTEQTTEPGLFSIQTQMEGNY